MIRRVFMLLLLLLTAAPTLAQTHPVTPAFTEYLTALESLPIETYSPEGVAMTVSATIRHRYPDIADESYATLRRAYAWLFSNVGPNFGLGEWNPLIIQAWLRENQPDLTFTRHLSFDDYAIDISWRDFNADGTGEYVFDVVKTPDNCSACGDVVEYSAYLVVQAMTDGYHVIVPPLGWQSTLLDPRWSPRGRSLSEVGFRDVNADGLPEWLFVRSGLSGCSMGQCVDSGELMILGWREGEFVHLTDHARLYGAALSYSEAHPGGGYSSMPRTVTWEFYNADLDPTFEIFQRQQSWTNWGCQTTTTRIFDWNSATGLYQIVPDTRVSFSPDSRQCIHQQAEEAMWAGDYETAITLYERAQIAAPNVEEWSNSGGTVSFPYTAYTSQDQYLLARSALAYILTGRGEQAQTILSGLNEQTFQDSAIGAFVAVLAPLTMQPEQACIAAYTVFTQNYPLGYYGVTGIELSSINPPMYYPERIGCDAPALIDHLLETTTFPVNESPLDGLERLGLAVRRSLTTDFDADGRDEWLVWLETPVYPVLFAPANERYAVSRPAVDIYGDGQEITVQELPDDFGSILAYVRDYSEGGGAPPWARRYYIDGYGGYAPYHCSQHEMKTLWLWYFDGSELYSDWFTVCQDHLEALFSADGRTINGGVLISHCPDYGGVCTGAEISNQWVWDVVQGRYVPPPVSRTPTPIATPVPTIVPPTLEPPPSEYDAQAAWQREDYAEYIAITDVLLPTLTDNPEQVFGLRYRRGLVFELLGQPEQALAEYQAIYDQALGVYDDWAALAAIHLPE